MSGRWMEDNDLPGFKAASLEFMHRVQHVSEQLMVCFARGLGLPDDYFIKVHDVSRPDSQTVARLLHYFETPKTTNGEVYHRAGAHTDWDLVTLLFQKAGQSGLEVRLPLVTIPITDKSSDLPRTRSLHLLRPRRHLDPGRPRPKIQCHHLQHR
jgi:isopenicillin N synthase-like dioxygenase